jgi:hypothetical protein
MHPNFLRSPNQKTKQKQNLPTHDHPLISGLAGSHNNFLVAINLINYLDFDLYKYLYMTTCTVP